MKRKRVEQYVHSGLPLPRTLLVASFLALISLLFPVVSPALDLTGTSRSYLSYRETADKSKLLPAYEYLDFSMQKSADCSFSAHFGGWGRYDLMDESFGKKTDTDLQYGYLSYRKSTDNTVVNLGRVMVFDGVANERIDGIHARTDLKGGFGIAAFGGSPVETGIDLPKNSTIYGARLSHEFSDIYKIGVSYLKEEKDNKEFRTEEGVDISLQPMNKVSIIGRSSYNSITSDWMEHSYALSLGPFDKLRLGADFTKISYRDYFGYKDSLGTSTISAFTFMPGILNLDEKLRTIGTSATYMVTDKVLVALDYKRYGYSVEGAAPYYGGKIGCTSEAGGGGVSYHRMNGADSKLRYSEYRIYGYKKAGHADLGVELFDVAYDEKINGETNAYSASIGAGYEVTEQLKLGADFEYAKNPDYDKDVRAFIKVIYKFGAEHGTKKGA